MTTEQRFDRKMAEKHNKLYNYSMYKGRIDRIGFLLGTLYVFGPIFIIILVYAFLFSFVSATVQIPNLFPQSMNFVLFVTSVAWTVFLLPIYFGVLIRRWHDMNVTGWLSLVYLVPVADVAVYLVLQFAPGTPGANEYGLPRSPRDPVDVLFCKNSDRSD